MDLENYDAPYLTTEEHAVLDHSGVPYGNAPPTTQYDAPYLTTPEHALIDHTGIPVDSESPANNSLYDAPYLTVDEHSHIDHTGIPGAGEDPGPTGFVCVVTLIPQDVPGPVGGSYLIGSIECSGVDPLATGVYALFTLTSDITLDGESAAAYVGLINCAQYLDSEQVFIGSEFSSELTVQGSSDGLTCFGVLNDPADWVGVLEPGQAIGVNLDGAVGGLGAVTLVIG